LDFSLVQNRKGLEINQENEKPPAAVAGGGLGNAVWLKLVGQACIPAHILEFVIRMAGMDGAMHGAGEGFELALDVCMRF
jgi:hypothetical protein